MKAIILSAGKGTRLRPLTNNIPKVMVELGGKPLLLHQIEWARNFGIKNIGINLHYQPEAIKKYFGTGKRFGVKIFYSFEEKLLGTAGALHGFKDFLDEPFFLIYGDVFHRVALDKLADFHQNKKGLASLVVRVTDHPQDSDLVELDKNQRVIKIHSKPHQKLPARPAGGPATNLSNAAIYLMELEIISHIGEGELDFGKDVLSGLIEKGLPLYGFISKDYIRDMGTLERYQKVEEDFPNL